MTRLPYIVADLGFESDEEFVRLTLAPDLSMPGAFDRFQAWKRDDGTKRGLLAAFPDLATNNEPPAE